MWRLRAKQEITQKIHRCSEETNKNGACSNRGSLEQNKIKKFNKVAPKKISHNFDLK